jgi:hypothetical protein
MVILGILTALHYIRLTYDRNTPNKHKRIPDLTSTKGHLDVTHHTDELGMSIRITWLDLKWDAYVPSLQPSSLSF